MQLILGIIATLIGFQITMDALFGFSFPFFKIGVGIFLIYLGISFLGFKLPIVYYNFNTYSHHELHGLEKGHSFKTMFCSTSWHLNDIKNNLPIHIKNKTSFGTTTFFISPHQNVKLIVKGNFGTLLLPDKEHVINGKETFFLDQNTMNSNPDIIIDISLHFGTIKIMHTTESTF